MAGMFGGRMTASDLANLYFNVRPPATISAPKPRIADRVENAVSGVLGKVGMGQRSARRIAGKATGFLNDLTPLGSAVEAESAKRAYGQGNYGATLGHGILAALSALPDGGALGGKVMHSIIAPLWHGSPHKFDKFSLSKIGTGEGAQAYGHGLYFAENPESAKAYRDTLSPTFLRWNDGGLTHVLPYSPEDQAIQYLQRHGGDFAAAKKQVQGSIDQGRKVADAKYTKDGEKALLTLERMEQGILSPAPVNTGHLYEVSINAEPEDFLDWDAPIASQQKRFGKAADQIFDPGWNSNVGWAEGWRPTGADLVGPHRGVEAARRAEILRSAGIPGLKYFDQGSRQAGQGSRNYVVFDDSIIDILNRK